MRWLGLIIVALAGCGRLGFASESIDAGEADARGPGIATPEMCDSRHVATLPLDEAVLRVRATAVPDIGYAVALETAVEIHIAKLDERAELVSFHTPFLDRYVLHGIGTIGQVVFVSMDFPAGPANYLKRVDPGWDSYQTSLYGNLAMFDPPVASAANQTDAWTGTRSGPGIHIEVIDATGAPTGEVPDYQPANGVHGSFAPSGDYVRVAIDRGDDSCETFQIARDGTVRGRRVVDGCREPRGVGFPDGSAAILSRTAPGPDTYDVRWLPPTEGAPAPVFALGEADEARIAPFQGPHALVAFSAESSGLSLVQLGPEGVVTGSFPEGRSPFDLLPGALFWMVGPDLHVAEPCLR